MKPKILILRENSEIGFTSQESVTRVDYIQMINRASSESNKLQSRINFLNEDSDLAIEVKTFAFKEFYQTLKNRYDLIILLCDYTKTLKKILLLFHLLLHNARLKVYYFTKAEYIKITPQYLLSLLLERQFQAIKLAGYKIILIFLIIISVVSAKLSFK